MAAAPAPSTSSVRPKEFHFPVTVEWLGERRVAARVDRKRAKPFWRLLETVRPGWQEQARWLREHGQELHDYEPARALSTA